MEMIRWWLFFWPLNPEGRRDKHTATRAVYLIVMSVASTLNRQFENFNFHMFYTWLFLCLLSFLPPRNYFFNFLQLFCLLSNLLPESSVCRQGVCWLVFALIGGHCFSNFELNYQSHTLFSVQCHVLIASSSYLLPCSSQEKVHMYIYLFLAFVDFPQFILLGFDWQYRNHEAQKLISRFFFLRFSDARFIFLLSH